MVLATVRRTTSQRREVQDVLTRRNSIFPAAALKASTDYTHETQTTREKSETRMSFLDALLKALSSLSV